MATVLKNLLEHATEYRLMDDESVHKMIFFHRMMLKRGINQWPLSIANTTRDMRLPYIYYVEACVLNAAITENNNANMATALFCGNDDWTRELTSYIGCVDEHFIY